jgi:hypothetical protein
MFVFQRKLRQSMAGMADRSLHPSGIDPDSVIGMHRIMLQSGAGLQDGKPLGEL